MLDQVSPYSIELFRFARPAEVSMFGPSLPGMGQSILWLEIRSKQMRPLSVHRHGASKGFTLGERTHRSAGDEPGLELCFKLGDAGEEQA
jgi:hypothetical protein